MQTWEQRPNVGCTWPHATRRPGAAKTTCQGPRQPARPGTQVTEPAFSLFELHIPHALLHSPLGSGDPVMVTGYRQGEDAIVAVSIASRMAAFGGSSTEGVAGRHRLMMEQVDPNAALAAAAAAVAAAAADAAAAVVAAATRPRGLQAVGAAGGDGPTGAARAAAAATALRNTRVVRDMPVLYMVVGMCGFGPSISVQVRAGAGQGLGQGLGEAPARGTAERPSSV